MTFHGVGAGWEERRGLCSLEGMSGGSCRELGAMSVTGGGKRGERNGQAPGITPDLPVLLALPLTDVTQETTVP